MFRYAIAEKEKKQFDADEEKCGGKEANIATVNSGNQTIAAKINQFGRTDANE